MVEYADFHATVATLSPVFLLAGLVGLYKLASFEPNPVMRRMGLALIIGLTVFMVVLQIFLSLMVLAGFLPSIPGSRWLQLALLMFQLILGVGLAVFELSQRQNSG